MQIKYVLRGKMLVSVNGRKMECRNSFLGKVANACSNSQQEVVR